MMLTAAWNNSAKILALVLLLGVMLSTGFVVGHYVADQEWKRTQGRNSLVRIATDLKIISYLEAGTVEAAKNMLDVDLDGNVKWIVEYDSLLADDESYIKLRNRDISRLKTYWDKNPPFTGKEWETFRKDPTWIDLRTTHQHFLDKIANNTTK